MVNISIAFKKYRNTNTQITNTLKNIEISNCLEIINYLIRCKENYITLSVEYLLIGLF